MIAEFNTPLIINAQHHTSPHQPHTTHHTQQQSTAEHSTALHVTSPNDGRTRVIAAGAGRTRAAVRTFVCFGACAPPGVSRLALNTRRQNTHAICTPHNARPLRTPPHYTSKRRAVARATARSDDAGHTRPDRPTDRMDGSNAQPYMQHDTIGNRATPPHHTAHRTHHCGAVRRCGVCCACCNKRVVYCAFAAVAGAGAGGRMSRPAKPLLTAFIIFIIFS